MLEKLIAYFSKKHLLTNLIFVSVLIGGVFAWQNTSKEELPDITFDRVRISVGYPGAPSEDVEYFVTRPIEEELRSIEGVYRITSTSSVGQTNVTVEIEQDYPDLDEVVAEIRNAVLDVHLPDEVIDDPVVRVFKTARKAILDIALLHKDVHILDVDTRRELQKYAFALENQLLSLPEVDSVNKRGYLKEEIRIEVYPERLARYEIPFNTVMKDIRDNHLRKPAGTLEAKQEPKVTVLSELDTPDTLKDFIIQGGFEGQVIRLGEVAEINRAYEKSETVHKVNGHEAIMFSVVKTSSVGILDALDTVTRAVGRFKVNNLKGIPIELVLLDDESIDVRNRLSLIRINGGIGFILIVAILFLFLNKRSGVWVAMGIPFTLCFTVMAGSLLGFTINGTTLAAVIIVLGMVVDDAIVVAENISRLLHSGVERMKAVVQGTSFVLLPILASVTTTCVAFVPLFFFSGHHGKFIEFIPPIVFLMLGASLIESIFILPGHMAFETPLTKRFSSMKSRSGSGHWFERIEDRYGRLLEHALPYKWIIVLGFITLLLLTGWAASHQMKFVMFPNEETRDIVLTGKAPPESTRYETARKVREIEDLILPRVGKEVVGFRTDIARSRRGGAVEDNQFRMIIEIVPKENRRKSADQIVAELKESTNGLEGFNRLEFRKSRWGQDTGSALELMVQQNDDSIREKIVTELVEKMRAHPKLMGVEMDESTLVPEYRIRIDREKIKRLAITPGDIASTFRAALEGTVLYEYSNGDEDVRVRLTTVEAAKRTIDNVLLIPVENRNNYLVPLKDIVSVEAVRTPNSISRRDLKRTSYIDADLRKGFGWTPLEAAEYFENDVFPDILSKYPTTTLSFGGEVQDTRESRRDLGNAVTLALVLIYFILAILFNSLSKPFIVMLAIPFGIVGVVLAFILHGKVLFGFYAAVGVLGLAGVVINDSIIMLVKLDKEFEAGKPVYPQVARIAKTRLRAVILTTLTTVAGLLPTAYGFAGYDAMLAEMMLALTWGMIFGTLITLVLIPCVYSVWKSFKGLSPLSLAGALLISIFLWTSVPCAAGEVPENLPERPLSMQEFITLSAQRDTEFDEILIDGLALQYEKALKLPAKDLVLETKGQYEFIFNQDREEPEASVTLSKLFPFIGTDIEASYEVTPKLTSNDSASELGVSIAQPIAQNAFGHSTRLLNRIVGIEIDVARHQIVEAYEDYLAFLMTAYLSWYEAYENLNIGKSSYRENLKLLDNIKDREKSKIALPIDVNKITIQVHAKKEKLVELEEAYKKRLNVILRATRHAGPETIVPERVNNLKTSEPIFEEDFSGFEAESRTYQVLRLLEKKSDLKVSREANDLLPSIDLLVGYESTGIEFDHESSDNLFFTGFSLEWPFPDQVDRAEYNVAKIDLDKTKLSTRSTHHELYENIKNLHQEIDRETQLAAIAAEKVSLAQAILDDEAENYTFGKVTLNDYIDAVNGADNNRFNQVLRDARLQKLIVEWSRLTDRLISQIEVEQRHPDYYQR